MKQLFLFLLYSFIACVGFAQTAVKTPATSTMRTDFPTASQYNKSLLSHKIIPSENGTWGYEVFANGKKFIHQPSIPGLQGNEGFKTKAGAEKVARLVMTKIANGEMPPTVEIEEMKKLKAL